MRRRNPRPDPRDLSGDARIRALERAAQLGDDRAQAFLQTEMMRRSDPTTVILALLAQANGRRRTRILDVDVLWETIALVFRPGLTGSFAQAWSFGGNPSWGLRQQRFVSGVTTVALVVRDPETWAVTIGIKKSPAPHVSPGRAWKELKPWPLRHETLVSHRARFGDVTYKIVAWARTPGPDKVRLDLSEAQSLAFTPPRL